MTHVLLPGRAKICDSHTWAAIYAMLPPEGFHTIFPTAFYTKKARQPCYRAVYPQLIFRSDSLSLRQFNLIVLPDNSLQNNAKPDILGGAKGGFSLFRCTNCCIFCCTMSQINRSLHTHGPQMTIMAAPPWVSTLNQ